MTLARQDAEILTEVLLRKDVRMLSAFAMTRSEAVARQPQFKCGRPAARLAETSAYIDLGYGIGISGSAHLLAAQLRPAAKPAHADFPEQCGNGHIH